MEIFTTILMVLACLVFSLLILALFIPKHYHVDVSAVINKPKQVVFEYVRMLKNQSDYSEWLMVDPDLLPKLVGVDGTVGAVLRWESDNKDIGIGEQEIKQVTDHQIEVELRLIKPMPATCKLVNSFSAKGHDQTVYTCRFYGYAKYPINLPSYIIGRRFIRNTQQKTLNNIKAILEA